MIVGKVVGSIVSTRKSEKLIGNKFMIVEPVAQGSAARIGCGVETAPVDAAIVGIVDDGAGLE